jgi:predicted acetyltransferase
MNYVLVSCKSENVNSRKIIEKNKGIFEKIIKDKNDNEYYMYNIKL